MTFLKASSVKWIEKKTFHKWSFLWFPPSCYLACWASWKVHFVKKKRNIWYIFVLKLSKWVTCVVFHGASRTSVGRGWEWDALAHFTISRATREAVKDTHVQTLLVAYKKLDLLTPWSTHELSQGLRCWWEFLNLWTRSRWSSTQFTSHSSS
jgi:hypothetical protein